MSSAAVGTRPFEEEALFNAAFLAMVVRDAAADHAERSDGRGLPTVLAYLIAPLALHGPTRRSLPGKVTSQMGEWTRGHPEALIGLADRARALRPLVSDGIRLGLLHGLLRSRGATLEGMPLGRRPRGMARSEDVDACLAKSRFLGRWFAEQPDPMTAMVWWGLRP
jgi:hypothetical protein